MRDYGRLVTGGYVCSGAGKPTGKKCRAYHSVSLEIRAEARRPSILALSRPLGLWSGGRRGQLCDLSGDADTVRPERGRAPSGLLVGMPTRHVTITRYQGSCTFQTTHDVERC